MTMGQYDPEQTDLSAIARISGLGLPNFMTLFLFILCKSTKGHFDIRFQKVEKLDIKNFWGSSSLRNQKDVIR